MKRLATVAALAAALLVPMAPMAPAQAKGPQMTVRSAGLGFGGAQPDQLGGDPRVSGCEPDFGAPTICGGVGLTVDVAGFAQFHPLTDCPVGHYPICYYGIGGPDYGAGISATGEARIVLRCTLTGERVRTVRQLAFGPFQDGGGNEGAPSEIVTSSSAVDADTASLSLESELITDRLRGLCATGPNDPQAPPARDPFEVLSVRVEHLVVSFNGNGTYPDAVWRVKGSVSGPTALGENRYGIPLTFR